MTFNPGNDDDGYFNDLSRQPRLESQDSMSPRDQNCTDATGEDSATAKPKRIACTICRKRKLKCDGGRPKCATCARLGHNCAYDEVRRKSGPKRGYVKDLEARLGGYTRSFRLGIVELTPSTPHSAGRRKAQASSQQEVQKRRCS